MTSCNRRYSIQQTTSALRPASTHAKRAQSGQLRMVKVVSGNDYSSAEYQTLIVVAVNASSGSTAENQRSRNRPVLNFATLPSAQVERN